MNKLYGFKINKIIMIGPNKEDAFLDFNVGLNVISGASDTGKTFIFQVIDYMLGGGKTPKQIEEAKGYDSIFIEIEDYECNIYTLRRDLVDGKMYKYNCSYCLKDTITPENIKEEHRKNSINNISSFLLDLCNSRYTSIVKNKKGETRSFTYRDFARLSLLGEEKIIAEKSIILGNGGYSKYPEYKNAFKTIITGLEDNCKTISNEEKKMNNIKIEAKIEVLDNLITNYIQELQEKNNISDEKSQYDIEELIKDIRNNINCKKENLKDCDAKRQTLLKEVIDKDTSIQYNNEVIKKFRLLKNNYLSDLKRLEFIDDANYYINQLDDVKCPVCSSEIELEYINTSKIEDSIFAEKNKLNKKIIELEEVMLEIENNNIEIIRIRDEIKLKVDRLTEEINLKLKPIIDLKVSELAEILEKREQINRVKFIEDKLEEAKKLKNDLSSKKVNINNVKVELNKINDENSKALCLEISNLLDKWNLFKSPQVSFDLKTYDLEINGKKKASFGKGYRAIINSALSLAIMKYNILRGLPHPKIVVIDSPLITFKEKDSGEEKISEVVKSSFYKYLAENFKKQQVIVLENADPQKELLDKINYYHFTKNKNNGRYGFFPVE